VLFEIGSSKTITVDDDGEADFQKIQYAIDNATSGDTIRVWAGTYYENVVVNKTVSLVGNASANTTMDGGGNGDVVRITADWVNMSNFRVIRSKDERGGITISSDHNHIYDNNCSLNGLGIKLSAAHSNKISNNICNKNSHGIELTNSDNNNISLNTCNGNDNAGLSFYSNNDNNIVYKNICVGGFWGIHLHNCDYTNINRNQFKENNYGSWIAGSSSWNDFQNNTWDDNKDTGLYVMDGSNNNNIINDTFIGHDIYALRLNGRYNFVENNEIMHNYYGITIGNRNNEVKNSTILSNSGYGIAIYTNNNVIENNTIRDNKKGIYVDNKAENNNVHGNQISGSRLYGIDASKNSGRIVNATDNDWGHPSGPYHSTKNQYGEGDNVTDNVDFDPWIGYRVIPVHNIDQDTHYESIQEAIDDASSRETIRVYNGTFHENIVIDLPISIIGNGSSNSKICGIEESQEFDFTYAVTITADDITLEGFTIEGRGDMYIGLVLSGNDSTFRDLYVTKNTFGIIIGGSDNRIEDCQFSEIDYSGVHGISPIDMITAAVNLVVEDTIFTRNGIDITGNEMKFIDSHTYQNCMVDDESLLYYSNMENFDIINDCGQIFLANCENVKIENQIMTGRYKGITIMFSEAINITNCNVSGGLAGIVANNSQKVNIFDNEFTSNGFFGGIYLNESSAVEIMNNSFINNHNGILIHDSQDNIITRNTIKYSEYAGILTEYSSSYSLIEGNVISHGDIGILLRNDGGHHRVCNNSINIHSYDGIRIDTSHWNDFVNNTISNCDGIDIDNSNHISFENCSSHSNSYAFSVSDSKDIQIYHSYIYLNSRGISIDGSSDIEIHRCDITENDNYGLSTSQSAINASLNYWNHYNGPYHASENPDTNGDEIKGSNIKFRPWLRSPTDNEIPIAIIEEISPNPALEGEYISFEGSGIDEYRISRYAWRSTLDNEFFNSTDDYFICNWLTNGTHTIFLKVLDKYGIWSGEASQELIIHDVPIANIISISPQVSPLNGSIHFSGSATGEATGPENEVLYTWRSVKQGLLYNGINPEFSLCNLSLGNHHIFLKVRNGIGIWSEEIQYPDAIIITEHPQAFIDVISPNFILDAALNYSIELEGHGEDDGFITRYAWRSSLMGEFYNGTDSKIVMTNFTVGIHELMLSVEDNNGLWSNWTVFKFIIVNQRPTAYIDSIHPPTSYFGNPVTFIGSGTDDDIITGYSWRSDIDGLLSEEQTFSLSNLSNGTHTIFLEIMDANSAWSDEVYTELVINGIPIAMIESVSKNPAMGGESITFVGNGTDDNDIVVFVWWSNIDGEIYNGTEPSFSISYLSFGTHTIHLRVLDDQGSWSEKVTTTLTIEQKQKDITRPTITITAPDSGSTVKENVTFSGTASDNINVLKVEYRFAGAHEWSQTKTTTDWSFSLDTTQLEDGEYSIELRSFDGIQYSEIDALTFTIDNIEDEDSGDSDEFFLMRQIGPLPLIGYLGILIGVTIIGTAAVKKKSKKKDGKEIQSPTAPPALPPMSTTPPPSPSTTPPQAPQQFAQHQSSQYPPPLQAQQQPSVQYLQQSPPSPQVPQMQNWNCPQCRNICNSQHLFCMKCGYKRQ